MKARIPLLLAYLFGLGFHLDGLLPDFAIGLLTSMVAVYNMWVFFFNSIRIRNAYTKALDACSTSSQIPRIAAYHRSIQNAEHIRCLSYMILLILFVLVFGAMK